MTGRALFIVLLRGIGLFFVLASIVGTSQALLLGWDAFPFLGIQVITLALGLLCILGGNRVAILVGWPASDPGAERLPTRSPTEWMRVAERFMGWVAVVASMRPLAVVLTGLLASTGTIGERLWDVRSRIVEVVLLFGLAALLLLRKNPAPAEVP